MAHWLRTVAWEETGRFPEQWVCNTDDYETCYLLYDLFGARTQINQRTEAEVELG